MLAAQALGWWACLAPRHQGGGHARCPDAGVMGLRGAQKPGAMGRLSAQMPGQWAPSPETPALLQPPRRPRCFMAPWSLWRGTGRVSHRRGRVWGGPRFPPHPLHAEAPPRTLPPAAPRRPPASHRPHHQHHGGPRRALSPPSGSHRSRHRRHPHRHRGAGAAERGTGAAGRVSLRGHRQPPAHPRVAR